MTKLHTVPFLINGSDHTNDKVIDVVSPSSGEVVHQYYSADVKEANAAVDAAAGAFKSWRKTRPSDRRDLLFKAAEIMERRRDELRSYAMSETGSDATWANFDITTAISHIKEVAGRVGTLEGAIPITSDPNTTALVLREPYGVVLAIAPWHVVHPLLYQNIY
jgi:acyl-CoA reductase-like NAD-dependent aldehyde dehydrogenase